MLCIGGILPIWHSALWCMLRKSDQVPEGSPYISVYVVSTPAFGLFPGLLGKHNGQKTS